MPMLQKLSIGFPWIMKTALIFVITKMIRIAVNYIYFAVTLASFLYIFFHNGFMLKKVCVMSIHRFQLVNLLYDTLLLRAHNTSSHHHSTVIQPGLFHKFDKA
jgi:hypothetical protein